MDVIKFPYGLTADLHFHNWNAFSSVSSTGINSRLYWLIKELFRLAEEVKDKGGNTIILAGDVFHVRGSISPSVLNPVLDIIKTIVGMGIQVVVIAGNHDLEGKDATRIGSAVTALEGVGAIVVERGAFFPVQNGRSICGVSWVEKPEDLKLEIENAAKKTDPATTDLILHAPVDGVIAGLPSHGLTDEWLSKSGFNRVFAGHYHNHKDFGNGVYSIGALAHHTWSDVGTKAGFLLVYEDRVAQRASRAPKFIHVDETTNPDELPLIIDGNYVRAKIGNVTAKEVAEMREMLEGFGAVGSVIHAIKSPVIERDNTATTPTSKSVTVEQSVADYIASEAMTNADEVLQKCLLVLSETEEV